MPASVLPIYAALLIAASFLTSLMTAALGIGGGSLMIVTMSYFIPTAALIPVHGAVQFGSNSGRAFVLRRHVNWAKLGAFSAGAILGTGLGAAIAVRLSSGILLTGLGLFVIASTWIPLPRLATIGKAGMAVIGAATSFVGMFFGVTAPINAALLSNSFDKRQTLVGSLAAINGAQHGFKIVGFAVVGFHFLPWLPLILVMIASGFLGTLVGTRILHRLPEQNFRLALKLALTALALELLYRGLSSLL